MNDVENRRRATSILAAHRAYSLPGGMSGSDVPNLAFVKASRRNLLTPKAGSMQGLVAFIFRAGCPPKIICGWVRSIIVQMSHLMARTRFRAVESFTHEDVDRGFDDLSFAAKRNVRISRLVHPGANVGSHSSSCPRDNPTNTTGVRNLVVWRARDTSPLHCLRIPSLPKMAMEKGRAV